MDGTEADLKPDLEAAGIECWLENDLEVGQVLLGRPEPRPRRGEFPRMVPVQKQLQVGS